MIGRQKLNLDVRSLKQNLSEFDYVVTKDEVHRLLTERDGYAEPFLEMLGASEICSFDASGYENATHIHDLNLPIAENIKNRFSMVLDGGTLEHIFNFPVAIKNCMEMVEVGGHFIGVTPANNFCGHGFYQFSPELFFRIFCAKNAFKLVRMVLFEETHAKQWFDVSDPEA